MVVKTAEAGMKSAVIANVEEHGPGLSVATVGYSLP